MRRLPNGSGPGLVALALVIALGTAQPAWAAQPAQAQGAARRDLAMALARVVQPQELVLESSMRVLDRDFVKTMAAQEEMKLVEAQFPGFVEAYWQAARPELRSVLARRLPKLWEGLADIYVAGMTDSQLVAARNFYGSPTGQKIIRIMNDDMDAVAMLQDAMKNPDSGISAEAYRRSVKDTANTIPGKLNAEEMRQVGIFAQSDVGRAVVALTPKVQAFATSWMNESDPADDARMEAIALETLKKLGATIP